VIPSELTRALGGLTERILPPAKDEASERALPPAKDDTPA
jgi:hypothetical protein